MFGDNNDGQIGHACQEIHSEFVTSMTSFFNEVSVVRNGGTLAG